jgi:uncharacterized protein YbjT (DUF2867 family)
MKLAVIGASGRTGRSVLRIALEQGVEVYPVLRDDRELASIVGMVPAGRERFGDFESTEAMVAALHGCTHAIAAIQPRCTGPGFPVYGAPAATAILEACTQLGVERLLWCGTQAAYHWSPHRPSMQAYPTEITIKRASGPWGMVKFSAYHDEILEAYVAPEDGGRPRPVPRNGMWSPVSRDDAARMLLSSLSRIVPQRVQCAGGPEILTSEALQRIVASRATGGRGRLTAHLGLPDGDQGVTLEDTLTTTGLVPQERLAPWLDARLLGQEEPGQPTAVYPRGAPAASPLDAGDQLPLWEATGPVLRRVLHELIGADLRARGLEPARLDFSQATPRAPRVEVHGGTLATLRGVRALDADGGELLAGEVNWLRDELAEELRIFFGRRIPDATWDELDAGVRRRLAQDPRYRRDKRVVAFAGE